MKIDRQTFFAAYEAAFGAITKPERKAGFDKLLGAAESDPHITDIRWLAYMLATVKHECADRWLPIEEFSKGKGLKYGVPVTVTDAGGNAFTNVYYGRGYVQLTWDWNYKAMGEKLGNRLLYQPELALDPVVAYQIMSLGMRNGSFTGKGLSKYINDEQCDYVNARRIINGTDKAQTIAGYAARLEAILRASVIAATDGVPVIPPQPATPAPVAGTGERFTVTASALNVRGGPDTSNAAVGTVREGTVVTAVAEQNGWRQITAPVAGWVSGQYLQPVPTAQFTVTAESLNVRSGPDKANAAIDTVSKGTVVTAVAEQNGWREITAPVAGWVSAQYLQAAVPAHA
ncbi:SH3 domain-containing protein [Longimicrobium sp.]|uniref:SH3 domain-containing protein n=1 Tax=Longimicrobium sp. TaxID=2029185 RepID=UPI003B3BD746